MRIAILVLATLLLAGSAVVSYAGGKRLLDDAKTLDQAKADDARDIELAVGVTAGKLRTSSVAILVMGALSLLVVVLGFAKNKLVPHGAIVLVVAALATILISPQYNSGDVASARDLSYVIGVLSALGAAAAYGARALGNARQRRGSAEQAAA